MGPKGPRGALGALLARPHPWPRREAAWGAPTSSGALPGPLCIPVTQKHQKRSRFPNSVGNLCLIPALRNTRLPPNFKGPRKIPNYTADIDPAACIETYDLAMDMLHVGEEV